MLGGFSEELGVAAWAFLLVGFAYAAYTDVRSREASDGLWLVLGAIGFVLGLGAFYGTGSIALLGWVLAGGLVLQHFLPWDLPIEHWNESLPGIIELVAYVGVGLGIGYLTWVYGLGPSGLPAEVLAVYVTVLFARALFEFGLLYGGADAKALIAAAVLIPLAPPVLASVPEGAARLASVVPGPLTLLMNAAILSISVPIAIAFRNVRAREFEGGSSFVGYRIPVAELTERFVWLRDPLFGTPTAEEEAVESSDDDRALRERQRERLEAEGVERVWVTPQIPFLVFFFAGALSAAIFGNLLFDLIGVL